MAVADEQAYQEMMETLETLMQQINETCDAMRSAAQDCVDNTEEDANAQTAASKIDKSVNVIAENTEKIQKAIKYLQEEIDKIIKTREKLNFND